MINPNTIKISDTNGLSANVMYERKSASHKVEYFQKETLVGKHYFNTEYEATNSARKFIDGELNDHFDFF